MRHFNIAFYCVFFLHKIKTNSFISAAYLYVSLCLTAVLRQNTPSNLKIQCQRQFK